VLWLLTAPIVWGMSFPIVKALGAVHGRLRPGDSSWTVVCCIAAPRFLFGGVLMLAWCARRMVRVRREEWEQAAGLAVFCGLGFLFQVDGLQHTSASTSAFFTQLYAVLIPVWAAVRARRAPAWTVVAACAMVVVGGGVLAGVDPADLKLGRGEAETLLASVFFMFQILWLEKPAFSGNDALRTTTLMFGILGVGFAVVLAWMVPAPLGLLQLGVSPAWMSMTAVLTVACTVYCFVVMNTWQPKVSATEAGLIYCVEPVSASVLALVLPAWLSAWTSIDYANERVTSRLLVGGALVTFANVVVQWKPLQGRKA
jgi:drug/metabolite transporter (DMT)-like permease